MDANEIVKEIKRVMSLVERDNSNFCWKKAYGCSLASLLSYDSVSEYEVKNQDRMKIIPCEYFIERLKSKTSVSMGEDEGFILQDDDSSIYVIEKDDVIVTILRVVNDIFISVRGTALLHDFKTNLDFFKVREIPNKNFLTKFHSGFFKAAKSCFYDVLTELDNSIKDKGSVNIYVTGHSLGGAIAAIVFHFFNDRGFHHRMHNYKRHSISCYTFGMPRYGNKYALLLHRNPFHIHNLFDIVPSVPPSWAFYDDDVNDICIDNFRNVIRPSRKGSFGVKISILSSSFDFLKCKDHVLERYVERLKI